MPSMRETGPKRHFNQFIETQKTPTRPTYKHTNTNNLQEFKRAI